MERAEKNGEIDILTELFKKSEIMLSTDYLGLTVLQITNLRKSLRKAGARGMVIKNTLGKISGDRGYANRAKGDALDKFKQTLTGPSFVIFSEDPVAPTKALVDFAKTNEKLKIKGALFEGTFIDPKGVDALSKMPGKAETLAALLRVINAPATQLLRMVQAPGEQLVRVLEAHRKNVEKKAA